MRVAALYMSPVKSLALNRVERIRLGKGGFEGDRRFFLVDAEGKLFTQRKHFALVQIRAEYDPASERLALNFPDGGVSQGEAAGGDEAVSVNFHGLRDVQGQIVEGPFAAALSAFCGRPVRMARVARGGAFDAVPISICSMASVRHLAGVAGLERVDERRFRQNIWVEGAGAPHEEDSWIGHTVRIGTGGASLRLMLRDERCVVTTRDPDTGDHDLDTLKLVASYRRDEAGAVNFGVYAGVDTPGEISIGDEVQPLLATPGGPA